jgi:hypothetical protein
MRVDCGGRGGRRRSPGFVKTGLTAKNKFPMPSLVELDRAVRMAKDRAQGRDDRVSAADGGDHAHAQGSAAEHGRSRWRRGCRF